METPSHIIYGIDGKRFCDCSFDENGNPIYKTEHEEITMQLLQAQTYNPKAAMKQRNKRRQRHSA